MVTPITKTEWKEWKRFVGEENGLCCRHTASEAPSLVKTLGEVGNVGLGLQGRRLKQAWCLCKAEGTRVDEGIDLTHQNKRRAQREHAE